MGWSELSEGGGGCVTIVERTVDFCSPENLSAAYQEGIRSGIVQGVWQAVIFSFLVIVVLWGGYSFLNFVLACWHRNQHKKKVRGGLG